MEILSSHKFMYRADIDGLRAFAILSVLVGHFFPEILPGGFIGVDVFFVLSGYLITGIILKELELGDFSFILFWSRRIRRLFPSLIIVLLAVYIYGWIYHLPREFVDLGNQIFASAAFYNNILNYLEVGYFDAPATAKPLLHLWSLGVEEQFYIFFPIFLVLIFKFSKNRLPLIFLLLSIFSFLASILLLKTKPSFVFYFPFTRLWEFMLGGCLAYINCYNQTNSVFKYLHNSATAILGIVIISLGLFFVESKSFPGWWALIPTIGSCLIIIADRKTFINRNLLGSRILVFIGLISYPLYLWHWPLLVFIKNLYPDVSINTKLTAIAVAFVLSFLSYKFIELPIRELKSGWIKKVVFPLLCLMSLIMVMAVITIKTNGLLVRFPENIRNFLIPTYTYEKAFTGIPGKFSFTSPNPEGYSTLLLMGDSHSEHLYPGLKDLEDAKLLRVIKKNWGLCSPISPNELLKDKCRKELDETKKNIITLNPDIVVFGAFWVASSNASNIDNSLAFLKNIGIKRVVLIGQVPLWEDLLPKVVYKEFIKNRTINLNVTIPERIKLSDATLSSAKKVDTILKNLTKKYEYDFVSAIDTLCNSDGCLVRVGDKEGDIMQTDLTHFSFKGAQYFINMIRPTLLKIEKE